MKFALLLIFAAVVTMGCRRPETVRPHLSQAELQQERALQRPHDSEILQKIVGEWVPDPRTDSDEYHAMSIRPDGSFTTVLDRRIAREGRWQVQHGMLLLTTTNRAPAPNGCRFHDINYVDGDKLVCGIDISVAGRMRFTK